MFENVVVGIMGIFIGLALIAGFNRRFTLAITLSSIASVLGVVSIIIIMIRNRRVR